MKLRSLPALGLAMALLGPDVAFANNAPMPVAGPSDATQSEATQDAPTPMTSEPVKHRHTMRHHIKKETDAPK